MAVKIMSKQQISCFLVINFKIEKMPLTIFKENFNVCTYTLNNHLLQTYYFQLISTRQKEEVVSCQKLVKQASQLVHCLTMHYFSQYMVLHGTFLSRTHYNHWLDLIDHISMHKYRLNNSKFSTLPHGCYWNCTTTSRVCEQLYSLLIHIIY